MKLHQAFNVVRGDVVAFTGAGGKTSALIGLGYELQEAGWRVLATTTTCIAEEQLPLMPHYMRYDAGMNAISLALTQHGFVFLYDVVRGSQVYGPRSAWLRELLDSVDSDVLLIEADGAGGLPLKAPYDDEPTIPDEASLVVPVASLSALDLPLDEEHVYNPKPIMEKFGFPHGSKICSPWIAQVLRDDDLGLRGIPQRARVVAFLNQTPEEGYKRHRAQMIAKMVLRSPRMDGVALGAVRGANPVLEVQRSLGAVVLAAGRSSRMGAPKVLLPWSNGQSIVEHIVAQLIRSRIDHINVVTGFYADDVKERVKPMGAKAVHNRQHKTGEMLSSIKAGLRAMPDNVSAALIVLGDQPRIEAKVIYELLRAYAEVQGDLIIPSFEMRRGHPILLGRRFWQEVLALPRSGSMKSVINKYQDEIVYINVDTDSILRDVDTPADYEQERLRAGLDPLHMRRSPDA
jgi:molybdenum cofactor cytidylyltransferase